MPMTSYKTLRRLYADGTKSKTEITHVDKVMSRQEGRCYRGHNNLKN
jgi:hypothetical protein